MWDHGRVTVLLSGGGGRKAVRRIIDRLCRELVERDGAATLRLGLAAGSDQVTAEAVAVVASKHGIEVVELPATPHTGDVLTLAALVVGDGDAAQQLMAFGETVTDLRGLVHRGASYVGIGSGAAIAAEQALLGGSELGGVPVAPTVAEAEQEVELTAGLGLIDLTVLPHAAASGRIGLGIAVIEAGFTDRIVGLDDETTLAISDGALDLLGPGSMWELVQADDGVLVRTSRAAES